jgi:hypothetical protein
MYNTLTQKSRASKCAAQKDDSIKKKFDPDRTCLPLSLSKPKYSGLIGARELPHFLRKWDVKN